MIDQVVTSIGWQSLNDRETVIRKENIIESIPKLKKIQTQIADEYKGNIKKYIAIINTMIINVFSGEFLYMLKTIGYFLIWRCLVRSRLLPCVEIFDE